MEQFLLLSPKYWAILLTKSVISYKLYWDWNGFVSGPADFIENISALTFMLLLCDFLFSILNSSRAVLLCMSSSSLPKKKLK